MKRLTGEKSQNKSSLHCIQGSVMFIVAGNSHTACSMITLRSGTHMPTLPLPGCNCQMRVYRRTKFLNGSVKNALKHTTLQPCRRSKVFPTRCSGRTCITLAGWAHRVGAMLKNTQTGMSLL